jgi:hypothetical protein
MSVSWQEKMEDAADVHEVIGIARDYLASWDRHELAALPEPCRPGKVFDANDIQAYALQLVRNDCTAHGAAAPLIEKMAKFFSLASVRCSQILATAGRAGRDEARQSA